MDANTCRESVPLARLFRNAFGYVHNTAYVYTVYYIYNITYEAI